jgi:hypothetical protein
MVCSTAAIFVAIHQPEDRPRAQAGMPGMRRDDAGAGEALPALREPLRAGATAEDESGQTRRLAQAPQSG